MKKERAEAKIKNSVKAKNVDASKLVGLIFFIIFSGLIFCVICIIVDTIYLTGLSINNMDKLILHLKSDGAFMNSFELLHNIQIIDKVPLIIIYLITNGVLWSGILGILAYLCLLIRNICMTVKQNKSIFSDDTLSLINRTFKNFDITLFFLLAIDLLYELVTIIYEESIILSSNNVIVGAFLFGNLFFPIILYVFKEGNKLEKQLEAKKSK